MVRDYIFRSKEGGVVVPQKKLLLDRKHEGPALFDGLTGQTIMHQQVPGIMLSVASGLHQLGIRHKDVVRLMLPNMVEFAPIFLGIVRAGAICTAVNPAYTPEELARQAQDSQTKMVITTKDLLSKTALMPGNPTILSFGSDLPSGVLRVSHLLKADPSLAPPTQAMSPSDTCALPYSSGTTGTSKGAMLSHRNFIANIEQQLGGPNPRLHHGPGDTILGILPMFHIYGLNVLNLTALRSGSRVLVLPRFDFETVLRLIQTERVTVAPVVPPIVLGLVKLPLVKRFDLSSLRVIISGAAPLEAKTEQALQERFPNCRVGQGYGMSESSPVISVTPGLGQPGSAQPRGAWGSAGTLVPLTEAKIVDLDSGESLGTDKPGELWIRGPQVMQGVPATSTTRLPLASTLTPYAWLKTGDIGYFDSEGNLFLVDRAKELIKFKGFQVPPAELEGILISHSKVADAAVVPRNDDEAGEVPVAFVVLQTNVTVSKPELMHFVASKVAPYKKLKDIFFVEEVPKSATGKILRRGLRAHL